MLISLKGSLQNFQSTPLLFLWQVPPYGGEGGEGGGVKNGSRHVWQLEKLVISGSSSPPHQATFKDLLCQIPYSFGTVDIQMPIGCPGVGDVEDLN